MKILTNVQTGYLSGISQTFGSFLTYLKKGGKQIKVTGVDIQNIKGEENWSTRQKRSNFTLLSTFCRVPNIGDTVSKSQSLAEVEAIYEGVIGKYQEILQSEKPDLVLLNGTYFLPWCLDVASRNLKIPTVLHYHGILSKEVAHWEDHSRILLEQMEKSFDRKDMFYIFPSNLAKDVVENEVFKHSIKHASVLPNPIPRYFFDVVRKQNSKNIGIVSRWTRVKNPSFILKLARHNKKHGDRFQVNVITDLAKGTKSYRELAGIAKFRGSMDNERLAKFYASMAVVVSPSHFETYGNVAQEALASSTPALVSSQMGVSETFRKLGLSDWIVDFNSVRDVYSKMKEMSKQGVSPKVKQMIFNEFSSEIVNRQLLDILVAV
ncbi:glycosyltransferase family 4 protein [Candidatus Microgenomates bacterium]|nr:glycosyltransferase family 4 protein [Candidatus Microgenomates bacterium]